MTFKCPKIQLIYSSGTIATEIIGLFEKQTNMCIGKERAIQFIISLTHIAAEVESLVIFQQPAWMQVPDYQV